MTDIHEIRGEKVRAGMLPTPEHTYCSRTEQSYDVYRFNEKADGRPLVVYLGLGTTALTGMGQAYLSEYTATIDRPLFTLQPHTNRWRSLSERASSDMQALQSLGVEDMDLVGASSGAMLASYVAAQAGEQARHLVTVSCVGTKTTYREYIAALPGQFLDGLKEAIDVNRRQESMPVFGPDTSHFFNVRQYGELARTMRQVVNSSLWEAADELHETTRWTDIVGTKDHMTDYRDHLEITRRRNQHTFHSSSLHLLGGETHMWATKRSLLAEMVRVAIDK